MHLNWSMFATIFDSLILFVKVDNVVGSFHCGCGGMGVGNEMHFQVVATDAVQKCSYQANHCFCITVGTTVLYYDVGTESRNRKLSSQLKVFNSS